METERNFVSQLMITNVVNKMYHLCDIDKQHKIHKDMDILFSARCSESNLFFIILTHIREAAQRGQDPSRLLVFMMSYS